MVEKTSQKMSDADVLALMKKIQEQYRIYKEINHLENITREPTWSRGIVPTPERPLGSGMPIRKVK